MPLFPTQIAREYRGESERQRPCFMLPPRDRAGGERAMKNAGEAHVPEQLWFKKYKAQIDSDGAAQEDEQPLTG